MNFLAHAYLSKGNSDLLVGNFIGDFIKGRSVSDFDLPIQNGVILHRKIDSFTDTHPIFRLSKSRLLPEYRHYSAVLVDMFYDHFLARNWDQYHQQDLYTFTRDVYSILEDHQAVLPERLQRLLFFMEPNNLLFHYRTTTGLHKALLGMSRRTRFDSGMDRAIHTLKLQYRSFESDFQLFFPELEAFVKAQL